MMGIATGLALLLAGSALPAAEAVMPQGDVETIETRPDETRRMTVPVRIGEHGPFQFLIDTGSQTTVVSNDLAGKMALPPGRKARIVGVSGTSQVDTAIVEELGLGRRSRYSLEVALLEARHIGADGIVGIDSLQSQRVLLDFAHNRMTVGDVRGSNDNRGYEIVITARRRAGQLIMTDARIDGVRTNVIIDTGADTSIGNLALKEALRQRSGGQHVELISVTGQRITADLGFPRKMEIGDVSISNLLVAYADAPVFKVLGLDQRPALMLGMRELQLFKRVAIDFGTRKIMFDLPEIG